MTHAFCQRGGAGHRQKMVTGSRDLQLHYYIESAESRLACQARQTAKAACTYWQWCGKQRSAGGSAPTTLYRVTALGCHRFTYDTGDADPAGRRNDHISESGGHVPRGLLPALRPSRSQERRQPLTGRVRCRTRGHLLSGAGEGCLTLALTHVCNRDVAGSQFPLTLGSVCVSSDLGGAIRSGALFNRSILRSLEVKGLVMPSRRWRDPREYAGVNAAQAGAVACPSVGFARPMSSSPSVEAVAPEPWVLHDIEHVVAK